MGILVSQLTRVLAVAACIAAAPSVTHGQKSDYRDLLKPLDVKTPPRKDDAAPKAETNNPVPPKPGRSAAEERQLIAMAKNNVAQRLKDPASAQFRNVFIVPSAVCGGTFTLDSRVYISRHEPLSRPVISARFDDAS
jgi:hypothetical protein